jgi:NAD(P)-dependent dehydrogenase (short-subunit alcohol dehydrogenase family)
LRKVVLITGATRGLGKASAIEAARRGMAVAVTGRTLREGDGKVSSGTAAETIRVPGSIERTVEEIEALGGEALGIPMDIASRASIDAAIDAVLARWGRLDGLFNNALDQSPALMAPISAVDADEAEAAMRGLFVNHLHITQRALVPMLEQGAGRIVFISSGAGATVCERKLEEGGWGMLYAAGKAAFSKLAEFTDLEYRDRGIAAFHIQPGLTLTEALLARYGDAAKTLGGDQPVFTPADSGRTVAWMLDAPEALRFAGPAMHFAPTFFRDHELHDSVAISATAG